LSAFLVNALCEYRFSVTSPLILTIALPNAMVMLALLALPEAPLLECRDEQEAHKTNGRKKIRA
jgi:hypothetical protein